jgi:hypothetical protein
LNENLKIIIFAPTLSKRRLPAGCRRSVFVAGRLPAFRFLNKHFPRIQNTVRVKHFFDGLHYFECRFVDGDFQILGFDVADAVFAGDRAAEFDR